LGSETADTAGELQVFGVTPILSSPRFLLLPRVPVIHPRTALFRVAVVIVPDALIFPTATCRAAGTRVPRKPVRLIVCAFLAVQVSVAVTVEGAPPGTDAGDKEMLRSAGEQVAAAIARIEIRVFTRLSTFRSRRPEDS
jgi:hypothetical protein